MLINSGFLQEDSIFSSNSKSKPRERIAPQIKKSSNTFFSSTSLPRKFQLNHKFRPLDGKRMSITISDQSSSSEDFIEINLSQSKIDNIKSPTFHHLNNIMKHLDMYREDFEGGRIPVYDQTYLKRKELL